MTRFSLAFLFALGPLSACSLIDSKSDDDEDEDEDEDDGGGGWFEADADTDADSDTDTDADTDTDTDTDTDSDTDADTDADTNPYSSFTGTETRSYGYAMEKSGQRNCEISWDLRGTPLDISSSCDGCEFVFEVDLSYDSGASYDDGTCAVLQDDFTYTYAYTSDYEGYGAFALIEQYGYYYAFAYADFSGSSFTYSVGYEDYYYDGYYGTYPDLEGYYFTDYTSGSVTVK